MRQVTREKLEAVLKLHDEMKNSFFWSPPSFAASRRNYEKKNSLVTQFQHKKENIVIIQKTECSCTNISYKMNIYVSGKLTNKNIRFVKNLLSKG